jgi:hypothetical protein
MGLLKKIGKTVKKTVRKVVPKELAGIMQVAAPFVAPTSLPGALALSLGGQLRSGQGKINPFSTLAAIAPSEQFRNFYTGYDVDLPFGKSFSLGDNKLTELGMDLDEFLYGFKSSEQGDIQGILGIGGEFGPKKILQGKLLSPKLDANGNPILSKARVAALVAGGASLLTTKQEIEEEGEEAGLSSSEIARLQAEAEEMWQDFDTTAFRPKITAAIGGLMRKNLREGSEGNELPPDPTKPIGVPPGFKPKPIGPVLPNKAEASPMSILNDMAIQLFGKPLDELDDRQKEMIMSFMKPKAQQGGLMRANYALGTMPTKEESGLGGLPIEADMRYTGGFMPYGAKEKADDVPARLSKNEFVFTADAVRAAGGGSVQKGAQKMYNSMKQLEAMGKMA